MFGKKHPESEERILELTDNAIILISEVKKKYKVFWTGNICKGINKKNEDKLDKIK